MSLTDDLTLYHYWRSSSSWRVRLALALKGLQVTHVHVNLLDDETDRPEHRARSPFGYVPVLQVGSRTLIESMAILEWLDEVKPDPVRMFPGDVWDRAHVRALCEVVNAGIQPVANLPVVDRVTSDPGQAKLWHQWAISRGLSAYEGLCAQRAGSFSFGDTVTAADCMLVPQVYNALRFDVDLAPYPTAARVWAKFQGLSEFRTTHPDQFKP
jgi:maleylacetoacetate isomerase